MSAPTHSAAKTLVLTGGAPCPLPYLANDTVPLAEIA